MPKVSIFTPTHNPIYINDCYGSLKAQSFEDWEWVILLNGEAPDVSFDDPRVIIKRTDARGIGALKAEAVSYCSGDILLEFDHDDWLLPLALEKTVKACEENPEASLVFSDTAYMNEDGSPSQMQYQGRWNYSSYLMYNKMYHRCHSQAATPENVGVIWYAPNHLRAFPRWAYEKVGGYDKGLHILDDLDIMQKLFIEGEFYHIDDLLYLQRMHTNNSQFHHATNLEIQQKCIEMYRERIGAMTDAYIEREAAKRGWKRVDS